MIITEPRVEDSSEDGLEFRTFHRNIWIFFYLRAFKPSVRVDALKEEGECGGAFAGTNFVYANTQFMRAGT